MKRITFFATFALGITLLSACGSPIAVPEPTAVPAQPTETVMPTAEATVRPSPTPAQPTTEPTAEPTTATSGPRVQVTLADNTVNSTLTSFKTGVPYTFVIQNKGRHEHNFIIAPPVALAGGYAEALAGALLAVDETQIAPGSSITIEFTFPASAAGAKLEFSCLIRRHYEDGMRQDITVSN
jgi:uncharacterized cupredoxin-like copper-binding protein